MSQSIIRIMCPNLRCRAVLAVPNEARGRLVRCKNCGSNIRIPTKPAATKGQSSDSAELNGATGDTKKKSKKAKDAA